jgi:hypothetical protein
MGSVSVIILVVLVVWVVYFLSTIHIRNLGIWIVPPHQNLNHICIIRTPVTETLLAQTWLHVLGFYPHAPATNEETLERCPGFDSYVSLLYLAYNLWMGEWGDQIALPTLFGSTIPLAARWTGLMLKSAALTSHTWRQAKHNEIYKPRQVWI